MVGEGELTHGEVWSTLRVTRPAVPTGLERSVPDCWTVPGGTDRCLCGTVLTVDLMASAAAHQPFYTASLKRW
jgi:hypothetical protein